MPYDDVLDPLLQALLAYIRQQAVSPEKGMRLLLERLDRLEEALREMAPPPPNPPMDSMMSEMMPKRRGFSLKTIGSNY